MRVHHLILIVVFSAALSVSQTKDAAATPLRRATSLIASKPSMRKG